jgi:large subunit ribosomal protein L1
MAEAKKKTTKKAEIAEAELLVEATPAAAKAKAAKEKVTTIKSPSKGVPPQEVIVEAADQETEASKPLAKAGKRSEKAIKEVEQKQAKEDRKAATKEAEAEGKPKQPKKPTRTQLERKGKNYRKLAEQIDKTKVYSLKEALELATKTSPVKFDATVEMHVRLGVDPRQADQNLRDIVVLPAGTGKKIRIAVFADADGVAAAKKAGADIAASEEFLQQLDKGTFDFDVLISTPAMMAKLGKYARALGPKGLMPNPKSGTVTNDVAKAVTEAKAGRVEYRIDSTGIVHVGVGKVSFGTEKLEQNTRAILSSLKANKPTSLKKAYVLSIFIASSMGPSIPVEITEL